jgi:hypothetical protein
MFPLILAQQLGKMKVPRKNRPAAQTAPAARFLPLPPSASGPQKRTAPVSDLAGPGTIEKPAWRRRGRVCNLPPRKLARRRRGTP